MAEENTPPAQVEVELQGGVKVKLAPEAAAAYQEARKKDKEEREILAKTAGAAKAEKDAAEQARAKAEQDKQAIELAGKGEVDKVRDIMTKEHRERESRLAAKYRDKALAASLAGNQKIIPTAIDDIIEQVRGRTAYDFETDAVVVLGDDGKAITADGKPVQVDTWLSGWLDKRPHYLLDRTPAGSGGNAKGGKAGSTMTGEAWEAMNNNPATHAQAVAFLRDGGSLT